jgi:CxxC motif-containing protein (DUF1111 family)
LMSARVAPAMIGLGLLETVPEVTLRALADPDDRDGDGISGRLNEVREAGSERPAAGALAGRRSSPRCVSRPRGPSALTWD